jgi:hypothetical protein
VDWDQVSWTGWECKGKGKDDKGDKSTTTIPGSNEAKSGGGQAEGGGVAEDETESDEEEELPHAITYEAFVDFSRNDKQRATLSEELKEQGCGTLLSLLRLWWDACQLERNSSNA